MNNFTYENTKDATEFYLGSDAYFEFFVMPNISHKNSISDRFVSNSRLTDTPPDYYVSLSRPHHETREFWTTNGVTQYAQPQGNEMDVKNLIPISYVKKFTPLVVDDNLISSVGAKYKVTSETLDHWNEIDNQDDKWFVVSFADRPNTGTQPVGDDVAINTNWNFDNVLLASVVQWRIEDNNETWKPNHAAMLKQWQAKQLTEEAKRMDNIAMNGNDGDHYDKPTFTKAMADAGELPMVGCDVVIRYMYDSKTVTHTGNVMFASNRYVILMIDGHEHCFNIGDYIYEPIQTAEEKAVDAMLVEMNTKMELRGDHDDYMVNDDTQVGVEFVIEYMAVNGFKWVGSE